MKQVVANIYSQDNAKEITDLLEREGYEIVWQNYPNNAIIVKEVEE